MKIVAKRNIQQTAMLSCRTCFEEAPTSCCVFPEEPLLGRLAWRIGFSGRTGYSDTVKMVCENLKYFLVLQNASSSWLNMPSVWMIHSLFGLRTTAGDAATDEWKWVFLTRPWDILLGRTWWRKQCCSISTSKYQRTTEAAETYGCSPVNSEDIFRAIRFQHGFDTVETYVLKIAGILK